MQIKEERFYFIKDEFFSIFPDCNLMGNKENQHNRPCYYCYNVNGYYWMVPISSQIEKYEKLYDEKIKKYKNYDGIIFGFVNGKRRAFLIQNVCPVTEDFISEIYTIQRGTVEVTIKKELSEKIKRKVKKVILLNEKHIRITLTDISRILAGLELMQTINPPAQ